MNPRELKALETATQAAPPLPANRHEDCQACRRKLLLEADPVLDRLPAYRGDAEADRLLRILDSLDSNDSNGRGQG
jgi:hypothetical protein